MMKKWLVSLAVVLALAASGVAQATPTVTGHTGYVDSTFVSLAGAGFTTTPPSVAYMWDFESNFPQGMHVGKASASLSRLYPNLVFGTSNTNRFFYDAYDTTGLVNEPFASVSADYAKFGTYGLKVRASEYNSISDSTSAVYNYICAGGAGLESIYLSAFFKITAADTTISGSGAGDAILSRFALIRFMGQNAANNVDIVKAINHNDSLRTCVGVGTWKTWDLAGANSDHLNDILDGDWHRIEALIVSESTPASSSDGVMRVYLDNALVDSSAAVNWPNNTQGWTGVQLVPVVTADDGRKLNVYFDDLYVAGGNATTVDKRAVARVEFRDKIVFGNATEAYVQFPVSWAATSIVARQTGGFDATDKVFVMPVPPAGALLSPEDTCLDSLQSVVPVLGSAAITSAATTNYPGTWQTLGWTDTSDNGLLGRDSKKSQTIVDWGDGTSSTLAAAGDTTCAHKYGQAGIFSIKVTATNPAGSSSTTTSYSVYSNRTRYIAADGGKIVFPVGRDVGPNQMTINSDSACRIRLWKDGVGEALSWPIAAGVPWTVPANFDSLFAADLTDTVWVHVW